MLRRARWAWVTCRRPLSFFEFPQLLLLGLGRSDYPTLASARICFRCSALTRKRGGRALPIAFPIVWPLRCLVTVVRAMSCQDDFMNKGRSASLEIRLFESSSMKCVTRPLSYGRFPKHLHLYIMASSCNLSDISSVLMQY